ncbi:lrr receptor-like serine threonine-protein kinase [Hordeum vulgare]|nr:lrr receptor-like serine threonine-protein kinase [Hordeum vulgare]
MEDTRRTAAAASGDVLEKPGTTTATEAVQDVAGIQGGVGEAASVIAAVDLEKELLEQEVTASSGALQAGDEEEKAPEGKKTKLDMTGFKDPYDPHFVDDEINEYGSAGDVDKGNVEPFIAKEVEKIKAKGSSLYYKRKKDVCPYCTTKEYLKDGIYEDLLSHARDASMSSEDYKVRGQHAAVLKALVPH